MSDEPIKAAVEVLTEQLRHTKTSDSPAYGSVYSSTSIPDIRVSSPSWLSTPVLVDPEALRKVREQDRTIVTLRDEIADLEKSLQEKTLRLKPPRRKKRNSRQNLRN